jgi:iron complex transport system substrate-binding protein
MKTGKPSRERAAVILCLLAITGAATACGERAEPTGPTVHLYPVTVADSQDRSITLKERPRRVAALTRATADIVRALGAGSDLVGAPSRFFGPSGELLERRLRKANPDLVLAASDTDGLDTRATSIKAPVFFAPDASFDEVERAITKIGLLLDRPVAARVLVHRIEEQRAHVARELAGVAPASVFLDTGFFTTIPNQSLVGDLIRQGHGRNVAGANPASLSFTIAQLVRLDPSVYLATSDSGTTLRDLRRDRRTRKLRAVHDGRFAIVPARIFEAGPGVGDSLVEIAHALHPNAVR